ncbi:hypothetical protein Ndes2437B_g03102 [Nannochloris sp. 'desiccata']
MPQAGKHDSCAEISAEDFTMASSLLVEVAALRKHLAQKDILIAQQSKQIDIMSAKQKKFELHATKLEAAVTHRDQVIAELATSRKLVFEECHRACMANQAELRQMQDALHKVSRQLQRERREHTSRIKDLRRNSSSSSSLLSKDSTGTRVPLSPFLSEDNEMPWNIETDFEEATGLCYDEGVNVMSPRSPPNQEAVSVGPSSNKNRAHKSDDEDEDDLYACALGSPSDAAALHPEEVDFLAW